MGDNSLITQRQLQTDLENFYNTKVYPYLNGATHAGFTPVGTVISYFGETAPEYFLVCDGTEYAKSDYPQLADLLLNLTDPTPFEGSDANHFKVPDLRGEFLRGTGTNGHTGEGSGANVGVHQGATQHVGVTPFGGERSFAVAEVNDISGVNPDSVIVGNNYRRKYTYSSSSDLNQPNYYTSRPTNTSVLYCIAYKNIYIDLALDSFPLSISNPTDGQLLMYDATAGRWVNGGHKYSTDEHVVGTWIDGKPLYEKTLHIPLVNNNGNIDTAKEVAYQHNIDNVDFIFISSGTFITPDNSYPPLYIIFPPTNLLQYSVSITGLNRTGIYVSTYANRSTWNLIVTVRYTKTTD